MNKNIFFSTHLRDYRTIFSGNQKIIELSDYCCVLYENNSEDSLLFPLFFRCIFIVTILSCSSIFNIHANHFHSHRLICHAILRLYYKQIMENSAGGMQSITLNSKEKCSIAIGNFPKKKLQIVLTLNILFCKNLQFRMTSNRWRCQ